MKTLYMLLVSSLLSLVAGAQSVGIGTPTPNSNAVLEVTSTSKAMIVPRLSANAITALTPADGMLVFNTDAKAFWGYSSGGTSIAINQTNPSTYWTISNGNDVAQSFTPTADLPLDAIGVYSAATVNGGDVCQMRLRVGAGYSGTIVGTANTYITSFGIYYFDFSGQNILLQAGQIYTAEIDNLGGSPASSVSFWYATGNPYTGGNAYLNTTSYASNDLMFYVRQNVAAGWKVLSH